MDLYFKRHDGHAVTCEDFFSAMVDANGADFANFSLWCVFMASFFSHCYLILVCINLVCINLRANVQVFSSWDPCCQSKHFL